MTYQDRGSRVVIVEPDDPPEPQRARRICRDCGKRRMCWDLYGDGLDWSCVPCLDRHRDQFERDTQQREWETWNEQHPEEMLAEARGRRQR